MSRPKNLQSSKNKNASTEVQNAAIRDNSLDFLRGTAILFMIITHVNAIFYTGKAAWLDTFTWWGATICFTVFLFCSGAVYGLKLFDKNIDRKILLKRAMGLLVAYFVAAFGVRLLSGTLKGLDGVLRILLLVDIPEFTEFILAFALYSAVLALFSKQFARALKYKWLMLIASVGVFFFAGFLYNLNWGGGVFDIIKGLLVGHVDWHRFGILSYAPVFTLGLVWSWLQKESRRFRFDFAIIAFIFMMVVFLMLRFTGLSVYYRWPPSLLFMLYGVIYSFAVLSVWPLLNRLHGITAFLATAGRNALTYFVAHIWIMFGLFSIIGSLEQQEMLVILVLFTVVVLSWLVAEIHCKKRLFQLKFKPE